VSTVLYGNKKGGNSAETILNSKHHIHSIKRLSDGEIFTIGDKITGKSKYNCTINIIELNPNCNQIMFNRLDEGIDLVNAKHYKQPLFKTEDGVDIFEGMSFYYVCEELELYNTICCYDEDIKLYNNSKFFSTKEKAEEYIIMNKKVLSLNDIFDNCINIPNTRISKAAETAILNSLKKIVKNKLKIK
jgi:hypothetical protein